MKQKNRFPENYHFVRISLNVLIYSDFLLNLILQ